jgi:hypothetical protein
MAITASRSASGTSGSGSLIEVLSAVASESSLPARSTLQVVSFWQLSQSLRSRFGRHVALG